MSRGIHTKPNNGLTNEWLTPPEIIRALTDLDAVMQAAERLKSYDMEALLRNAEELWHRGDGGFVSCHPVGPGRSSTPSLR